VALDHVQPEDEIVCTLSSARKPFSFTLIHLISSEKLQSTCLKLLEGFFTVPEEFRPKSPNRFCLCETEVKNGEEVGMVCCTAYKVVSELSPKPTTLWLLYGPPITGQKAYVWKCQNNNDLCNV
jgi:hypothetical protein